MRSIIKWDPFRDLDRFFEDEDWGLVPMIRKSGPIKMPAMDVYQTDNDVIVEMEIPGGANPDNIDITIEGDVLTVKGESKKEEEEKGRSYYKKEIRRGSFERSVILPASVKGEEAEAETENGILKIRLPKLEEEKNKKIAIKVKK